MATKRKPPTKSEPLDFSAKLADSLNQKPEPEEDESPELPQVGDMVRIGAAETEYRVSYVSHSGREVNLDLPGTNLERFRVPVRDLNISGRTPRKPKEPEKPKINIEAVREHLEASHHSIVDHIHGEVATLKKWLLNNGVPNNFAKELDLVSTATEDRWNEAIQSIESFIEKE